MQIVLSANNRAEIFVMPYAPPDVSIDEGQAIENYDGLSFNLTMPGNLDPRKVSWSAIYPCRRQAFSAAGCGTDPAAFVEFIRKWRDKHWPIRVTITAGSATVLNMPCLVESFSHSYRKTGDMDYSLSLVEYQFI